MLEFGPSGEAIGMSSLLSLLITRDTLKPILVTALDDDKYVIPSTDEVPIPPSYKIYVPEYTNIEPSKKFNIKYGFGIINEPVSTTTYNVTFSLHILSYTTFFERLSKIANFADAASLTLLLNSLDSTTNFALDKNKNLSTALKELININKDVKLLYKGTKDFTKLTATPSSFNCEFTFNDVDVQKDAGYLLMFQFSRDGLTFYGNSILSPGNIIKKLTGSTINISSLPKQLNVFADDNSINNKNKTKTLPHVNMFLMR
jgi:hypothetical protein